MALVQITSDETGQAQGDVGALPRTAPVTIMLHGYKYHPGRGADCPHTSLYAATSDHPTQRSRPWPKRLGIGTPARPAIGFGWPARGSIWAAWRQAEIAGLGLARVIDRLKADAPDRPVRLLGHSLGARVALAALRQCGTGHVEGAILLNGADFISNALKAEARHAGTAFQMLNVTSRENAVFDGLTELCLLAPFSAERALGRGLTCAHALTLRLDDADDRRALAGLGFEIPPPDRSICHWSTYLRPGTGALYRALLDGSLHPHTLRTAVIDARDQRRTTQDRFAAQPV